MNTKVNALVLDVLIIGGGPSGLSVATGLARQLYTAVVFDSGVYRNALTQHMHNVPGWDHQSPASFRAALRQDLVKRYSTIQLEDVAVKSIRRTDEGLFEARDANDKTWLGKKVVLATGVKDIMPDIPGYADCWARGIFHCLFCHGFEERGCTSAGVLAIGDIAAVAPAIHVARMALRLASEVVIYTESSGELSEALEKAAGKSKIKVDTRPIARLVKGDTGSEVTIEFKDGTSSTEGFLVHKPKTEVNGPFVKELGLELTEQGDIQTSQPFYSTNQSGVFAVGDCAVPIKAVVQAVATGTFAAGGVIGEIQASL